jgi:hypothetical protein|tara:strand:+ start:469 stop:657 length:189 start_codon:yes stop_codon:yes gene_type:complete
MRLFQAWLKANTLTNNAMHAVMLTKRPVNWMLGKMYSGMSKITSVTKKVVSYSIVKTCNGTK